MTDMKQPEATPQNMRQITGNVADMNTVLIERAELHRLQAENDGLRVLASGGMELFERYSTFKAKCAELEAQLYAVGAGGVGRLMAKPQQPAQQAPEEWARSIMKQAQVFASAWSLVGGPFDSGNALECAKQAKAELRAMLSHPHPTENLHCKSTQKRLATLWGYEKARQPLTNEQIAESEREACAALCDDIVQEEEGKLDRDYSREGTAEELAVLIRARGQQ